MHAWDMCTHIENTKNWILGTHTERYRENSPTHANVE